MPKMSKKSLKRTGRATSGSQGEEFHLFQKLPTELRLKIWKLSLPGPRAITMRPRKHGYITTNSDERALLAHDEYEDLAITKAPALLQVNWESREVAFKSYRPIFRCQPNDGIVYFNFDIDYLHLPTVSSIIRFIKPYENSNLRAEEFQNIHDTIQHLIYDLRSRPTTLIADFNHLYKMSNLKTLVLWDGVRVLEYGLRQPYTYKSTMESQFKKARGDNAEVPKIVLLNSKDIENAVLQMKDGYLKTVKGKNRGGTFVEQPPRRSERLRSMANN